MPALKFRSFDFYRIGNRETIETDGVCYQSSIEARYQDLVTLLGEPNDGDGYRTSVEWVFSQTLKSADSTPDEQHTFTLYNETKFRSDGSISPFDAHTEPQKFCIGSRDPVSAEIFRHKLALELIQINPNSLSMIRAVKAEERTYPVAGIKPT